MTQHNDPRLESAYSAFLDAWQKHESIDPDEFCRTHPDDGPKLRRVVNQFVVVAKGLRAMGQPAASVGPQGPLGGHPDSIGPNSVVAVLGEGGMGTVFKCEQHKPVQRTVAVKLIRAGMHSQHLLARFAREQRALALMEHRYIARVLDAGVTEAGQPYLVMEFIDGLPITDYCRQHDLDLDDRIRLFQRVCAGVDHAHGKGVLHRDLKPSNIFVTEEDGLPVPKIIDFGLARAIEESAIQDSLVTRCGQVLGTPEYMSPEQAEQRVEAIDTRADVYSLGVILYELLTEQLPVSGPDLRTADVVAMRRILRVREPRRPSERFDASDISTAGSVDRPSREWRGRLRGELDWITMKALEKDPERRYLRPVDLSQDLQRFLAHEPVFARAPSRVYRVGKYVRRHRLPLTIGTILAAAGLAIAVLTSFAWELAAKRASEDAERKLAAWERWMNWERWPSQGAPDISLQDLSGDVAMRDLDRWLRLVTQVRESGHVHAARSLLDKIDLPARGSRFASRYQEEVDRSEFHSGDFESSLRAPAPQLRGLVHQPGVPEEMTVLLSPKGTGRDAILTVSQTVSAAEAFVRWDFAGRATLSSRPMSIENIPKLGTKRMWIGSHKQNGSQRLFLSHRGELDQGFVTSWRVEAGGTRLRSLWTRSFPRYVEKAVVGDLDGDGDLDLVLCGGRAMRLMWVIEDMDQPTAKRVPVRFSEYEKEDIGSVLVGDLFGLGTPEILVSTKGHHEFMLQRFHYRDGKLARIGDTLRCGSVRACVISDRSVVVCQSFTPDVAGIEIDPRFRAGPGIYVVQPSDTSWDVETCWIIDDQMHAAVMLNECHLIGEKPWVLVSMTSQTGQGLLGERTSVWAAVELREGAEAWMFGASASGEGGDHAVMADLDGDGENEPVIRYLDGILVMGLAEMAGAKRQPAPFPTTARDDLSRAMIDLAEENRDGSSVTCLIDVTRKMVGRGLFDAALETVRRYAELPSSSDERRGTACRLIGDIHLLRGDYDEADKAYRRCRLPTLPKGLPSCDVPGLVKMLKDRPSLQILDDFDSGQSALSRIPELRILHAGGGLPNHGAYAELKTPEPKGVTELTLTSHATASTRSEQVWDGKSPLRVNFFMYLNKIDYATSFGLRIVNLEGRADTEPLIDIQMCRINDDQLIAGDRYLTSFASPSLGGGPMGARLKGIVTDHWLAVDFELVPKLEIAHLKISHFGRNRLDSPLVHLHWRTKQRPIAGSYGLEFFAQSYVTEKGRHEGSVSVFLDNVLVGR